MSEIGLFLLLVSIAPRWRGHVPTHGALGAAAVDSLAAGIALVVGGAGTSILVALAAALRSLRLAPSTCGSSCTRRSPPGGYASQRRAGPDRQDRRGARRARSVRQGLPHGALWKARLWCPEDEEAKLECGDPIVVERVDGLTLTVRRAEDWELFSWLLGGSPRTRTGAAASADVLGWGKGSAVAPSLRPWQASACIPSEHARTHRRNH